VAAAGGPGPGLGHSLSGVHASGRGRRGTLRNTYIYDDGPAQLSLSKRKPPSQ
jgi:hypothetical protein